jgi:DNA-3-methyladenine glycosylase
MRGHLAKSVQRDWFDRPVLELASALIGARVLVNGVGGMIVECEAYAAHDPAAHSFAGKTQRNASMFGPAGHAYVYRSYGIHWCMNFVAREDGAGVLIRALAPERGLEQMRQRRGTDEERLLCSGPGKLTQALGITGAHDGASLFRKPFAVYAPDAKHEIITGPRIGISRALDLNWRFCLKGSPFVSKPWPK